VFTHYEETKGSAKYRNWGGYERSGVIGNITIRYTHTHTQLFYGCLDFVRDNPGELVPEKKHAPTRTYLGYQSSLDGVLSISYLTLIETMHLSCTVFKL